MRGVVWDGSAVRYTDALEVRQPGLGEVCVRMVAAGLCHSDLACTTGVFDVPSPMVMGHEGAGVVEAVGVDVTSLHVGDHVVLSTLGQCGACAPCERGEPTFCRQTMGRAAQPFRYEGRPAYNFANTSAFAERVVVRANQAIKIGADVPLEVACIVGCAVLTGAGAVWNRAAVRPGEKVAVVGLGGVGLSAVQAAAIAGAASVIAIDSNAAKASVAAACGASAFVAATGSAIAGAIRQHEPDGVDVAIVCAWPIEVMQAALDALGWGGRCVLLASPPPGERLAVDVNALIYVDRAVMGSRYGSCRPNVDIPFIVDLYQQGRFALEAVISGYAPLAEIASQLELLARGVEGRLVLTMP